VGTGRFAVVAHATCVGPRFSAITGEMSHLETIPAFNVFRIARFLYVKFRSRDEEGVRWAGGRKGEEGSYSTIAGMVTGLFTVATFLVGTIARIVTSLLTFLASDFFHVGRFLLVNTTPQTQNKMRR
jgi:hypothetical protein